jgi:hypothetical protein
MPDLSLGAVRSDPALVLRAWPIMAALDLPAAAPLKYHSPKCHSTTLDQNPWGACVTFSDAYVHSGVEVDEGYLIPKVIDPLATYFDIKGLPNGGPDPSPGLMPVDALSYLKRYGWITKDGSPRRKIGPYYLVGVPGSGASYLDAMQQTILQLGPFQFVAAWPGNWFTTLRTGHMKAPSATLAGGHAFEACGWEAFPNGCPLVAGCKWDSIHHQTWGEFGFDPEYPNHFRVHSPHWDGLGWESWKFLDLPGDAPAPPPPPPPPPTPEDLMVVTDRTPMVVDLPLGLQTYRTDGVTPLVKMSADTKNVYSPSGGPVVGQRYVTITTGGVSQYAVVNVAGLTLRPYSADVVHKVRVFVDGVQHWEEMI